MAGYYKNEKATADTIKNGWLHTGDMGYMDDDKFLYVVEGVLRFVDIERYGEKYSPGIEKESLADNSYFIDQVVLHNNQDPYTSALIVINKEALKRYVHRKKPGTRLEYK